LQVTVVFGQGRLTGHPRFCTQPPSP
jgi:hypothetical protein